MRYAHLAPEYIASKAGIVSFKSDNHSQKNKIIKFKQPIIINESDEDMVDEIK
jgi:hypothetical protein